MSLGLSDTVSVSVIVPTFHAAHLIHGALESVAAQTSLPRQVIVIDDASDDVEQLQVAINRFAADSRLPVLFRRLPTNQGPASARNLGWEISCRQSEYVAFLDVDDRWAPWKLRQQVSWMRAHPGFAWSAHRCAVDRPPTRRPASSRATPLTRLRLLGANPVATPSVMVDRRVAIRFRPGLRHCEDLQLWVDLLDAGFPGVLLSETMATLGRPPMARGGLTHDLAGMHAGMLQVLETLKRERRLSRGDCALLRIWENIRYVRRLTHRLTR